MSETPGQDCAHVLLPRRRHRRLPPALNRRRPGLFADFTTWVLDEPRLSRLPFDRQRRLYLWMNGTDLLADFRKNHAEVAFGELVRRYTNLVYSVAKRRLGSVCQAEEVTQTVFIRLAKAAPDLRSDAELAAWLHRTTVHASIDLWRAESRRRTREEHAAAMQPDYTESVTWNEIAPVLDEALNALTDAERQAILLRFFEQKSMRDLGLLLGISEDAAKMRVSRAMEHLRGLIGERGAVCGVAALAALLSERAVEAAPAGLVLTLAALPIPVAAGLGAASGSTGLLAGISQAKLVAAAAIALTGTALIIWLVSASHAHRVAQADGSPTTANLGFGANGQRTALGAVDLRVAEQQPDPLKLLQGVARARNRISSGMMELDMAMYEGSRPLDGTNRTRLKVVFDGNKRRFESFGREYAYTSIEPDASEMVEARRQAEGLDRAAAARAGLLSGFESHQVTAYDGTLLLVYRENDGRPQGATIEDPAQGGTTAFDPRCLGIDTSPIVLDTIESCLPYGDAASVELLGEEGLEGIAAWHLRARRGAMDADFWLESANPIRVLKYAFNGSVVVSKYDDANPRDPIPTQVVERVLHGVKAGETAYLEVFISRRSAQFDIPVDADSWTLAGLGMPVGTAVSDSRVSRGIGYWTGAGLSEDLPSKTAEPPDSPNRGELMATLEDNPSSLAALEAAQWIISNTPDGSEVEKAARVILQEHIEDTNLVHLCLELERLRHHCSRQLLEAMLARNPSLEVRANACLTLAVMRKDQAKYGENQQATAQAEKLFERVLTEFGRAKRNGTALADLAKPELYELRRVIVGKPAPETAGEDLSGEPMKLIDYRGYVVVISFWGKCGRCRPDVPALLKLQERMQGKRFAILGVYCDDDPSKANAIVEELGMTWPSFRDGPTGPISKAWNNNSWPTFNIVDGNGIIRYRHVWDLARAVDALMTEQMKQP